MDIKVNENTVIVFDLDDTLYNEINYLKSAYQNIAKQLEQNNWKPLFAYMFSLYRNQIDVFDKISSKYNVSKESLIKKYREHTPEIKLFDGVMDKIIEIKKYKGKVAIVTDGRINTQMSKIKSLGLHEITDKIIISEATGYEKPNENNFKLIENHFKCDQYFYIADNLKKDFISPNFLGWKTIGLLDNGLNIHNNSYLYLNKKHMPSEFISSFMEIQIK